jgi:hypothetical protein
VPYHSRVTKDWRAARNLRALDRLMQGRHERFPESVWRHAVARPLVPPTLTRAVVSYWRHHPLRADRLARALAARSGAPEGWSWHVGGPSRGLVRNLQKPAHALYSSRKGCRPSWSGGS